MPCRRSLMRSSHDCLMCIVQEKLSVPDFGDALNKHVSRVT